MCRPPVGGVGCPPSPSKVSSGTAGEWTATRVLCVCGGVRCFLVLCLLLGLASQQHARRQHHHRVDFAVNAFRKQALTHTRPPTTISPNPIPSTKHRGQRWARTSASRTSGGTPMPPSPTSGRSSAPLVRATAAAAATAAGGSWAAPFPPLWPGGCLDRIDLIESIWFGRLALVWPARSVWLANAWEERRGTKRYNNS
jgi:hypothetical protein